MGSFECFFRDHYRTVVRLAYSVVGDSQGAQDVAQEVFLAAYRRFPMAIAFVARHPADTSAIIGPRTMEHLETLPRR